MQLDSDQVQVQGPGKSAYRSIIRWQLWVSLDKRAAIASSTRNGPESAGRLELRTEMDNLSCKLLWFLLQYWISTPTLRVCFTGLIPTNRNSSKSHHFCSVDSILQRTETPHVLTIRVITLFGDLFPVNPSTVKRIISNWRAPPLSRRSSDDHTTMEKDVGESSRWADNLRWSRWKAGRLAIGGLLLPSWRWWWCWTMLNAIGWNR